MATVRKFPQPTPTKISKLAFKQRFTQAERIAVRQAAEQNAEVFDFSDLLETATYVDLTRPDTIAGVTAMEALGLLAEGRADEIINAPVQENEAWKE